MFCGTGEIQKGARRAGRRYAERSAFAMHSYNHLFDPGIASFESLYRAAKRAEKNKRMKPEVLEFNHHLERNLFDLERELKDKTYAQGEYRLFYVHDPKTRLISAAPFRDRVVHQSYHGVLEPIFEAQFIDTSFACRLGKGVDAGVRQVETYLRKTRNMYGKMYCLKGDVKKYFQSVNHRILREILFRRIRCKDTRWLTDVILSSAADPNDPDPVGIPVGNLPSQLYGNVYLNELDHFVKESLRMKYYVRYMDDFVILHHDKRLLHVAWDEIAAFLRNRLALELNHKTAVFPVSQGIDFLGYRIWTYRRILRKAYVKRIKRMMRRFERDYAVGRITQEEIRRVMSSWNGRAMNADVPQLKETIAARAAAMGIVF